jgi:large subunit ribosomal protein L44e
MDVYKVCIALFSVINVTLLYLQQSMYYDIIFVNLRNIFFPHEIVDFYRLVIFTLNYPTELILYMKMQKELRKFCPKCKTHTTQAVSTYKKGKDRKGAQGAKRHAEDKKGYGGQKFPELKRTAKTTKKVTLRYTCKTCQRKTMKQGMRIRKLEIQA